MTFHEFMRNFEERGDGDKLSPEGFKVLFELYKDKDIKGFHSKYLLVDEWTRDELRECRFEDIDKHDEKLHIDKDRVIVFD